MQCTKKSMHSHSGDNSQKTILIVEDNEQNIDMLSRRLEKQGYHILKAMTGEEGIEQAIHYLPDLILMDMGLPNIQGWDATKCIRTNSLTSDIPVIGLSAYATDADRNKALSFGCNDYETKPVDFKRLIDKIDTYL